MLVVSAISADRLKQVFFGNGVANGASVGNTGVSVSTPPGNPGPVDVAVSAKDGAFELSPEGFSFGPWIVETSPDASTAEGGGTATLYGYGFGPRDQGQQAPSNLQVSIGGQPAPVLQYFPNANPFDVYYPFPIQAVQVRVPSGIAGSKVDVTVSTNNGSITAKNAFTYRPAIQQFQMNGASLIQGIYDKHRGVYYFTDQHQVRIFSRSQGKWLSAIPITGAARLAGVALSPDGSKLAISDAEKNSIYLLNPDSPGTVKTFSLPVPGSDSSEQPTGIAVLNSGIIYYSSFFSETTGISIFTN